MSKTISILILILVMMIVWNAIDIYRQDQEIEELRGQMSDEQMKTFILKSYHLEQTLTQEDYEELFEEGELR